MARTLSPAEATSLLVELVEERKEEIRATCDESQIRGVADRMASQQTITRTELASWDASARSWIISADEVKRYEQIQLKLITKNVGLSVNSSSNTYRNVIEAWTTAMTLLDKLINGMPQSISKGAVLLGLSAWHIFPDLNVVGTTTANILFRDTVVAPGGIITIGLQSIHENDDNGMRWSLDLSYLRHYGDPVSISVSSTADGSRVTADELHLVAFGSVLEAWGPFGDDPHIVARTILELWNLIQQRTRNNKRKRKQELATKPLDLRAQWLSPLVNAANLLLNAPEGTSLQNVLMLINLGRRRGRGFLAHEQDMPQPLFGLCNPSLLDLFSNELTLSSQARAIAILRDHAARLGLNGDECIIRYSDASGHDGEGLLGYATAIPQIAEEQPPTKVRSRSRMSDEVHKRWLELSEPSARGHGCSCAEACHGSTSHEDSRPHSDLSGYINLTHKIAEGCPCRQSGRSCTIACHHNYSLPSYDCGNLNDVHHCAGKGDEEIYWIAPLKLPITSRNDSWTWRNPPSGFKTTQVYRNGPSASEIAPVEDLYGQTSDFFDAEWESSRVDLCFARNELYDDVAEFHYVEGSASAALFATRKFGSEGPPSLEVDELLRFLQSSYVKVEELVDYLLSYPGTHLTADDHGSLFAVSLIGLDLIAQLHGSIGPATISTSIIQSPLCEARWIGEKSAKNSGSIWRTWPPAKASNGIHFTSYSGKFACLAMLELGATCNIDPEELQHVIAMSSGNSIYVASPLLQDPNEQDDGRTIKRIIGNVGRPGITMMMPPPQPRIRPLSDSWKLVQHAAYDGKLEDCFYNTSLHLSFTTYELPLATGRYGGVDAEVVLVESLVSVYDRGNKVADLDVLGSLSEPLLQRLEECTCSPRASKRLRTKLISIDNWEELLDSPNHRGKAGVVRAHGNWVARLAATCISIQKRYKTVLVSKPPVCSVCVGSLFAAERDDADLSAQICIL